MPVLVKLGSEHGQFHGAVLPIGLKLLIVDAFTNPEKGKLFQYGTALKPNVC